MLNAESKLHHSNDKVRASFLVSVLSFAVLCGVPGCTRSLRSDAARVAQAGSLTAKQMAEYYESLQGNTVDTYELNAFREAYLLQKKFDEELEKAKKEQRTAPSPPSFEMSEVDKQLFLEYQKTYNALAARKRLAQAMQGAYASYAHLSEYDSTQEVLDSLGGLISTVNGAASLSLPDPSGTVSTIVQGLFKDIVTELTTLQQNRKLLRESNRLIPIVQKLRQVFDTEKTLCGGDAVVKDSQGNERSVSGIAGRRAATYKSVARQLVEGDAVISTALVNRVLDQYQLRWPEPQVPFTQPALKAGIVKIIESRAFPIAQLTDDAGEGISTGLGKLITLHEQLAVQRPLSLQEALDHSATIQVILDRLKARDVPVDFVVELLKAMQKGAQP